MEKKRLFYVFFAVACLINTFDDKSLLAQNGFDNYITISNGQFWDGSAPFNPLAINYLVDYAQFDEPNAKYFISPLFNYSVKKRDHTTLYLNGEPYLEHWGYADNMTDEKDSIGIKLNNDLRIIDSLGFKVVRLWPSVYWKNDSLHVPSDSYDEYFSLTDSLIAKCVEHNLRVILVLNADTNVFRHFDQYCVYLDSMSRHYSSNKAVMAYVVFAEPSWKWINPHVNDKIMISNWSRKWYYLIKKNAPNQLVTYGLDGLGNIMIWDPSALTQDFVSMHFYYDFSDINVSKKGASVDFKWMNENIDDVWVLGETGFSGTQEDSCKHIVSSEADQREYARFTTWLAVGCGCKGYSWWQYQDANWKSCVQNHNGLITTYPGVHFKQVSNIFPISPSNYPEPFACNKPTYYYDIHGYEHNNVSGVVLDENSNPIQDALVVAWPSGYQTKYSTFTDSQGGYVVKTPENTNIALMWISQKGYTAAKPNLNESQPFSTTLTHINYNRWKKDWTNVDYPITGDNPAISNSDAIVVGNFCDDEAQELLVVKYSTGTAVMYKFNIHHWEQVWTGSIGNWQISSSNKFYAGDFDGNGYDELLCVQNASNAVASIFRNEPIYSGNPWNCVWTNSGNGKIGNWNYAPGDVILPGHFNDSTYCSLLLIRNNLRPTALLQRMSTNSWESLWQPAFPFGPTPSPLGFDKYYVGDFNGNGYDELFCTQVTNGTSDQMNILQYGNNAWNSLWSNNGISEGVGIYPYRGNLHVGNFDMDRADELLGVGTWATKFDLNVSNQWDWSWSTYGPGKLSDWAVNPSHRIFFMKTMTDVPDYLFVVRGAPNVDFKFDAYSFDP